jgi:hypothetical protein
MTPAQRTRIARSIATPPVAPPQEPAPFVFPDLRALEQMRERLFTLPTSDPFGDDEEDEEEDAIL